MRDNAAGSDDYQRQKANNEMCVDVGEVTTSDPSMEIDLKCAEKVTDSDVESNFDGDKVSAAVNVNFNVQPFDVSMFYSKITDANGQNGDLTRKPKPINPMLQNETMHNYSPMPMYATYNSPKNPVGVMPFQPKGLQYFKNLKRLCEFSTD